MKSNPEKPIILFDGICNLCNSSVRFVLKNESSEQFLFSSIQSDAAKNLLLHLNYKNNQMRSILLIEQGQILEKSEAVLRIASGLRFPWNLSGALKVLPRSLLDRIYDWVAENRYRWFGQRDHCVYDIPKYENRFI
jgi:predicted DCC family thiol-disulfide oxidoreductase YuxK